MVLRLLLPPPLSVFVPITPSIGGTAFHVPCFVYGIPTQHNDASNGTKGNTERETAIEKRHTQSRPCTTTTTPRSAGGKDAVALKRCAKPVFALIPIGKKEVEGGEGRGGGVQKEKGTEKS